MSQSSVEFLTLQLIKNGIITNNDLKIAKEMHKEEIEDAYDKGCYDEYEYHINNESRKNSEIYYNETFEK